MNKKPSTKPCPFCGSSSVKIEETKNQEENLAYVFCKDCVAVGPSSDTRFTAVYNWNKREDEPPQIDRLLNIKQVCSCLGLSRASVYRLIKNGQFPRPLHLTGVNSSRWVPSDIEEYSQKGGRKPVLKNKQVES